MSVGKARCWCETEMLKLKAEADCVTELADAHANDGRIPDAAHLDCKVSALKASWISFEVGLQNLYGLVTINQEITEVREVFKRQLVSYNETLEKGESLQASLYVAGPAPLTLKERLDDCLLKRTHLFIAADNILASVFRMAKTFASMLSAAVNRCVRFRRRCPTSP